MLKWREKLSSLWRGPPTRFANFPRWAAWLVLSLAWLVMLWGILSSFSMRFWIFGHQGAYDLEFYRIIVERIQAGESYYEAAQNSFSSYGFPIRSMFNWRQPTCATLLGWLPNLEWGFRLLIVSAILSVIVSIRILLSPDCSPPILILGTLLLLGGAFGWSFYEHDAFLATEPWCEVLMLSSLCAYARGKWLLGMVAGLLALSLRELVLPYCVVAAGLACRERRRPEIALWAISLTLYVIFLYWHGQEVTRRSPSLESSTSVDDWLQPTGIRFILQTCCINVFLRPLPIWIHAIYLPLCLIGLAGWSGSIGLRVALSAGIYLAAFALVVAGEYWGYMYSAMLLMGFLRSPMALRDLFKAIRHRKPQGAPDSVSS